MSDTDKAKNKTKILVVRPRKRSAGLPGDKSTEHEGEREQTKSHLKRRRREG